MKLKVGPLLFIIFLNSFLWGQAPRIHSSDPILDARLQTQQELARGRHDELFGVLRETLTITEREGLEFLLAYAPLNDLADQSGEYFLEMTRYALKARNETPWGKTVPDDIFRHFVLPTRVNNENLDRFRAVMYPEIKARVQNLSLMEAALEINHWCHEKVTYQSTDDRTSSPLYTIRTAFGRCGEESTFTVAALRTAGIPARQCYAPRWAHVDDNHAWVEVWIDGTWHFLGACEPEPVLDKAWFEGPVKRAMLVHTKAYGHYEGAEPVLSRQTGGARLNLLSHYTATTPVTVTILDQNQQPVKEADVRFQLYNYAEFYTLHRQLSDDQGRAAFTTGLGDLLIWAAKGDHYGLSKVRVQPGVTVRIILNKPIDTAFELNLDFTPPPEQEIPMDSAAATDANSKRLRQEDEIRSRYVDTFIDEKQSRKLADEWSVDKDLLWRYFQKSRGNWQEIRTFLNQVPRNQRPLALKLLGVISEKDLRDAPGATMLSHLEETIDLAHPDLPDEIFTHHILNPRVANEWLKPYRRALRSTFTPQEQLEYSRSPEKTAAWIEKHIHVVSDDINHYAVPLSPTGVLSLGCSDHRSRDIFAVALCRSLGIPARLEPGSQNPQFFQTGAWHHLWPGQQIVHPAQLQLITEKDNLLMPRYATHFSLAQWQATQFETLEYPFDTPVDRLPVLELPPGSYRLLTGIRLFNDDIVTKQLFFTLQPGQRLTLPVTLRSRQVSSGSTITLPSDLMIEDIPSGRRHLLSETIPSAGAVLCFIRPGHEPSRHLLDDLARIREPLESWGGRLIFFLKERREADALTDDDLKKLPADILLARIPADQTQFSARFTYPFCILTDHLMTPLFSVMGYRVGTDSSLLQVLNKQESP